MYVKTTFTALDIYMTYLMIILKNNTFCGSVNINEFENWKFELELYCLASN